MKLTLKYFFVFIFLAGTMKAQTMSFLISIKNSGCNGLNTGKAEVNVADGNPPFTFKWDFGSEESAVSGLAPGNYSVRIKDALGNDTTVLVTIAETPCEIAAALVFTPNSDSFNDTWLISNIQFYPENLIMVFNRWGQKVYESKGIYEPWDGKDMLNIPLPDNSYYYIIYEDKKDKEPTLKGTVSIIR